MSRRRVLLVSFFYPPDPAIGGRRVEKFARYLPDFGWQPTVLTARTVAGDRSSDTLATKWFSPWSLASGRRRSRDDPTPERVALRELAGRSGTLGRTAYNGLRHIFPLSSVRMPDATLGWAPYAVRAGVELLRGERFDAILSSFGPPTSHIVASRLQAASGLPWIADYRDLWTDNHAEKRVAPFSWLEGRFERRVVRRAARLTTVSPEWSRVLASRHEQPVEVIYNGYDADDYPHPSVEPPADHFTITYVGTLYWPGQNPEPFLAALARLESRAKESLDVARFEFRLVGTPGAVIDDLAARYGVAHRLNRISRVSHRETLALQQASTALLFLGWREPAEGFLTAKLFEYLGSGRPILAVGPSGGSPSEILAACGAEPLNDDVEAIVTRLEGWLEEFNRGQMPTSSIVASETLRFTRRAQTERLAEGLDTAVSSKP